MPLDETIERAAEIARALLGTAPSAAPRPLGLGGNNALFRVETGDGPVALKCYAAPQPTGHDRFRAETDALGFLSARGCAVTPRLLGAAPEHRAALIEWVEGTPVRHPCDGDVAALVSFLADLEGWRRTPEARTLGPAAEAPFSLDELAGQIHRRRAMLDRTPHAAALDSLLKKDFDPTLAHTLQQARWALGAHSPPLPRELRTLSPGDVGFHNTLRRPDGSLAILDMEYFGWDDPARLVGEVLLHPAVPLSAAQGRRFVGGLAPLFTARDPDFGHRLWHLQPLYALRWALILLNRASRLSPQIPPPEATCRAARRLIETARNDRGLPADGFPWL